MDKWFRCDHTEECKEDCIAKKLHLHTVEGDPLRTCRLTKFVVHCVPVDPEKIIKCPPLNDEQRVKRFVESHNKWKESYLTDEELKAAYIKAQDTLGTRNFPLERLIANVATDKAEEFMMEIVLQQLYDTCHTEAAETLSKWFEGRD